MSMQKMAATGGFVLMVILLLMQRLINVIGIINGNYSMTLIRILQIVMILGMVAVIAGYGMTYMEARRVEDLGVAGFMAIHLIITVITSMGRFSAIYANPALSLILGLIGALYFLCMVYGAYMEQDMILLILCGVGFILMVFGSKLMIVLFRYTNIGPVLLILETIPILVASAIAAYYSYRMID